MVVVRFWLVSLALTSFIAPLSAEACSCRAPGPPCESLFSSTVFVGKVTTIEPLTPGVALTTFEVLETLNAKGALGKTVAIQHGTVGSLCGISFTKGVSYVVYAGGVEGALSVGACTRTHRLGKKDEDVEFARAIVKRTEAKVDGLLVRAEGHQQAPLAGAVVKVKGTETSAKVEASGKFALSLTPGRYELELESPTVTLWRPEPIVVEVPHVGSCPRPIINVSWNGTIRGRVTREGKPVAGVEVHALAKKPALQHWNLFGRSGDDGGYEIRGVEPGTFVVVVSPSDSGGMRPDSPYPTTWAPGVDSEAKARSVVVGKAGSATIDLEVPPARSTHELRVLVKNANGRAQRGAVVTVAPLGGTRSTGGATDEKGLLTVRELEGIEVMVRACMGPCVETRTTLNADAQLELVLK